MDVLRQLADVDAAEGVRVRFEGAPTFGDLSEKSMIRTGRRDTTRTDAPTASGIEMAQKLTLATRACWPAFLFLSLAACGGPEAVSPTEEGTSSSGELPSSSATGSSGSVSDETGPPPTSADTTSGTGSSSSTGETGTDTESPESLCGNGVVEEGEGCDDLDTVDEDGCNVDCTVSGSLLWSWDPRPEAIWRVGFDPGDALHAVVSAGDGVSVLRFDASGEVAAEFEASRVERPAEAPEDDPGLIESVHLQVTDEGVYVGLYEYWQSDTEFLIAGHVERVGEDGWIRAVEGGTQAVGPRAQGGVIAISGEDVVYAFNPDGTQAWVLETELSLRFDAVSADGSIIMVASDRVVAFDDATGDELWSFVEPEPDFVFQHVSASANELWLRAGRFPNTGEDSLFRLGLDGSFLELIEAPGMGSWHEMTASGNVAWMRDEPLEPILIEKLDADLAVLWAHDFETDEGWRHLAVDGRGTVAAAKSRELRVLAP